MIAALNAISHFLVDWTCVCALYSSGAEGPALAAAAVLYNTLAFSTQCLAGLLLDIPARARRLGCEGYIEPGGQGGASGSRRPGGPVRLCGLWQAGGMLLVALGALIPAGLIVRVVVFGLGNSLFHVAGGMVTLEKSAGKAAPLGVFVAPGAFGVTLGTLQPQMYLWAAVILIAAAAVCVAVYIKVPVGETSAGTATSGTAGEGLQELSESKDPGLPKIPVLPVALLTAAVAVRAIGGNAAAFTWKNGAGAVLLLTLFVFLGKALGGFVCDRLGAGRMSAVTITAAAVLTAFFAASMPASLIGQLLLNLSMPVTLWLLYRLMPQDPGLAFGLAASALWPGTIFGMLIKLTGPAAKALIILCFMFGLFAVLYSEKVMKRGKNNEEI